MTDEPGSGERGVVVWRHARDLLASMRPQVWVVLQDLSFDAQWREGQLVASTSARQIAEHLRIDPGTAASALRVLRDRGFTELSQALGAAGRFGLAAYTLHLPRGLEVISPQADEPRAVPPRAEIPYTVIPVVHPSCLDRAHTVTSPPPSEPASATSDAPRPTGRRRRTPTSREWSQGALDLGTGYS